MIHRYSFPSEAKAISLVALLMPKTEDLKGEVAEPHLTDLSILEECEGVVVWGFEDKYTYNPTTKLSVLTEKGLTFNMDVYWATEAPLAWKLYEIFPKTPSHF